MIVENQNIISEQIVFKLSTEALTIEDFETNIFRVWE